MFCILLFCYLDGLCLGFEDCFDFVVFIGVFYFDVQISFCCIGKGFEEVEKYFGRYIVNFFLFKFCFLDDLWVAFEVNSYLCQIVVYRQCVVVVFQVKFVVQCFGESFVQCQCGVFYGMVFVYFEVVFDFDGQVEFIVVCQLVEYMVEKVQFGINFIFVCVVQVELYENVGFFGGLLYFSGLFVQVQKVVDVILVGSSESNSFMYGLVVFFYFIGFEVRLIVELDVFCVQIFG